MTSFKLPRTVIAKALPFLITGLIGYVIQIAAVAEDGAKSASPRKPIPSATEIKEAQTLIADIYKAEFAKAKKSKVLADKRSFAGQLFKQGLESANEPAAQYVCWLESRKLMESVGDVGGAMRTIDATTEAFEVDALALKIESLEAVSPKSPDDFKTVIEQAMSLAEEARQQGNFESTIQLFQIAQTTAGKIKDRDLFKRISEEKLELVEQRKEADAYQKAMEILTNDPNDPAANLVVGKFLCLIKGDWAAGGQRLMKGSDPQLKALAEREAAVPSDLKQVLELAEAWWDLGDQERGTSKTRMQREAGYWYEIAALEATGLQKVSIDKRLKQVAGHSPRNPTRPGLLQVIFEGSEFNKRILSRIDPIINVNFGTGPAAPGLPADGFSIIWLGQLKVPVTAKYTLFYDHDDCGRLWVDGKCVIDKWTGGINLDQVEIQLTAGFHSLKVEYNELSSTAGINLGWKRPHTEREIIPDVALFHDPNVARARGVKRP